MGEDEANNEDGVFEADGDFGTQVNRNFSAAIALQVGDVLISGRGDFAEFPTLRTTEEFGVGTFDGNGPITYVGMQIATVRNGENGFTGIKQNSGDYENNVNDIEILPAMA